MRQLLTILLLLFAFQSMAQGNLQFNQIINIKNGDIYTVPAGKVLKITAIATTSKTTFKIPFVRCDIWQGQAYCYYDPSNVFTGSIGNLEFTAAPIGTTPHNVNPPVIQCSQCPQNTDYTTSQVPGVPLPFWLKAGQNIIISQGSGYLISAIEFNIVP